MSRNITREAYRVGAASLGGGMRGDVDGSFGEKTAQALEKFEKEWKHTVDGLPTEENLEKLRKARREARRDR